jgi:SAM-dependent methyltransferase
MLTQLQQLFTNTIELNDNIIQIKKDLAANEDNQEQTKDIFSDKWEEVEKMDDVETLYKFQYEWFLKLYGFDTEDDLKRYLSTKKTIIDTGCGLGYKAAWFARLAPHAIVIGIDISTAAYLAAKNFRDLPNLFFLQGDIANTGLKEAAIDFTVCDQVIMHTEIPENTFKHLADVTAAGGEFACYVYRKKALPRELIDDYFRTQTHNIPNDKMWEFSEQLTVLGKALSNLKVNFTCPDIPVLGIKGGEYDIQRFIYWNFLKCFWRDDWSFELSKSTNYDWYAPSNAKRFSKEEFMEMIRGNNLEVTFFHEEEACYSGRFKK